MFELSSNSEEGEDAACRSCSRLVPAGRDKCPHCGTRMTEYNRIPVSDTASDA